MNFSANSILLLGALFCMLQHACRAANEESGAAALRGERIFIGIETAKGRIEGHAELLPVSASRCVNCHAASSRISAAGQFAPALDRSWLLDLHPRRGAPASVYEAGTFCDAIRTGIDPQHIVMKFSMPRFALNDAQCAALWFYLTGKTQ